MTDHKYSDKQELLQIDTAGIVRPYLPASECG